MRLRPGLNYNFTVLELCTSLELFNLATKCARAEEGRLSLLELPAADPEEKKSKANDVKCKGVAVLARSRTRSAAGTSLSHPRAADRFAPSTTFTTTTPTTVKSSGPFEMDASVDATERNDRGYGRGGGRGGG